MNNDAIYEKQDDMDEIVSKLKAKHPEMFYAVQPSDVRCFAITNKPRPKSKKSEITITGATGPFAKVNPFKYILSVYAEDWETWEEKKKVIEVAKVLKRISDRGEGKLNRYDEQNHKSFLIAFGVGYENDPNLPNLLTDDIDWTGGA
jgi:hypothetical protein